MFGEHSEHEKLWRKQKHFFVIMMKVGNAWVEHDRRNLEDDAINEAKRMLNDPSVSAVKVEEFLVEHNCYLAFEQEDSPILKVPKKMGDTGRKQSCPKCFNVAPVYTDGATEWVFCAVCDGSFPV
jgi:hypothetical protein